MIYSVLIHISLKRKVLSKLQLKVFIIVYTEHSCNLIHPPTVYSVICYKQRYWIPYRVLIVIFIGHTTGWLLWSLLYVGRQLLSFGPLRLLVGDRMSGDRKVLSCQITIDSSSLMTKVQNIGYMKNVKVLCKHIK